ncbi:MAG: hypothetical protein QOC98_3404, partial [Frankiaceae bacterium]|nr:hypothetical protein [Frankiaceae bacterium]
LLALALVFPAVAPAQATPPAPACAAVDAALPASLAAWRAPAPLSGALRPGVAAQIALRPIAEVQTAIAPHAARDGGATTGARLDLEIATAGTYQVALSEAAWIDLVQGGAPLRSAANGHGPACSSIHKIVDFALSPGRYVIQLSGTAAAGARLLVIPR